ncbi:MAG: diaminopimelate epimerase [Pyrinomonadaceae bacterium]|nr:diaminopimelate epimerase [Pyrinomonadaceae bacterium]
MRFIKFHGNGNDYIVFEAKHLSSIASLNDFARQVCDRHYGAGADGVAIVGESEEADFRVRIFNADGSEAASSGNGTRCAAAYLYNQKLWTKNELRFETRAGVKLFRLREDLGEGRYLFQAEMGRPQFESERIPMLTDAPQERVVDYPLAVEGETVRVTAMQMCNPNCCVFVDDFERANWRSLGHELESHQSFPEKTNVIFVRVVNEGKIEARVWERGVGETFSSGTGACAATVAASVGNHTGRRVSVNMPGGTFEVEWRADGEVLLTGEAEIVYAGEWQKRG